MNICFSKGGCTTLLPLPGEWQLDYRPSTDADHSCTLILTVHTNGHTKYYCLRDSDDYPDLPDAARDIILFHLIKKISQHFWQSPYETIDVDILETVAIEEISDTIVNIQSMYSL